MTQLTFRSIEERRHNGGPVADFRNSWANLCVTAGLGRMLCRKCEKPVTGETCKNATPAAAV